MILLLFLQNVSKSNCNLYHRKSKRKKSLFCNICRKRFALNFYMRKHLVRHIKQSKTKRKMYKCNFCRKKFRFNSCLKRHVKNFCGQENSSKSSSMYECDICRNRFFDIAVYNDHMKTHGEGFADNNSNLFLKLKLRKLNGVWESKPKVIYKCNICLKEFHVETSLAEHMKIHENNDCQMQCEFCYKFISASKLTNHMKQIHKKDPFELLECNVKFDEKKNLSHGLTQSSQSSFSCTMCGVGFKNVLLLENHLTLCYSPYSCKYCGKAFNDLGLLFEHFSVCVKCVQFNENMNKLHNPEMCNSNYSDSSLNNESFNQSGSHSLTVKKESEDLINDNIMCSSNIKKENDHSIEVSETTCTLNGKKLLEQSKSSSCTFKQVSNNLVNENCAGSLNVTKKHGVCIDNTESDNLDCTGASYINETFQQTAPCLTTERLYEGTDDDNIPCIETVYFSIRKIPKVECYSSVANNVNCAPVSQNNILFICNICNKSSFTDRHSFALHMSRHSECGLHECIVCDKKFEDVLPWENHMADHQQRISLNLSSPNINYSSMRPNTLNASNSESIEPQVVHPFLENKDNTFSSKVNVNVRDVHTNVSVKVNNSKQSEQYVTNTSCKKEFLSQLKLQAHHNNNLKPFSCKYCGRTFSSKGPCTNHEKSHNPMNKRSLFSQNEGNKKLELVETEHHKKLKPNKRNAFNCHLCKKKFPMRCYWTNHMKLRHKINPNFPKKLDNLSIRKKYGNNKKSVDKSVKFVVEHKEKPPVPVDQTLNNSAQNINSDYCTICERKFAHRAALISHMNIHSDHKPYECKYCDRKFNMKGPFTRHVNTHKYQNEVYVSHDSKNSKKTNVTVDKQIKVENLGDSKCVYGAFNGNQKVKNLTQPSRLWFICDVCEKKFSTPDLLIIHRKSHPHVGPYSCKLCNKSYSIRHRWNRHLKFHYLRHKHNKNLKSNQQINNINLNLSKLKNSQQIVHEKKGLFLSNESHNTKSILLHPTTVLDNGNNTKSALECSICNKTYSTMYNKKIHMETIHKQSNITNLNPNPIIVDTEKKKPVTLKTTHVKQKNIKLKDVYQVLDDNRVQCKLCGKSYCNEANVRRHYYIIHSGRNEGTECNICGRIFKHKYSYQHHFKSKHSKLLKIDRVISNTKNKTRQHIVTVHKKKIMKYFCKICKMKFADNIALQKHIKTHSVNKYKCKDCSQQFSTNATLGVHILENHGVKNTLNKDKDTKTNLLQNSFSQSSSESVECEICFKVLKTPFYLSAHMRLHTGIKPFKCDMCKMTFRFRPNLMKHKFNYH